jgi:hypothetical protein
MYIDVGALIDGVRPVSRDALRHALRVNPGLVTFDSVMVTGVNAGKIFTTDPRVIGSRKLFVHGPCPVSREWALTIEARCAHLTVDSPV